MYLCNVSKYQLSIIISSPAPAPICTTEHPVAVPCHRKSHPPILFQLQCPRPYLSQFTIPAVPFPNPIRCPSAPELQARQKCPSAFPQSLASAGPLAVISNLVCRGFTLVTFYACALPRWWPETAGAGGLARRLGLG